MARVMGATAKRPRISIDVQPELRSRLCLAAAKRDQTVRQYLVETIEARLRKDLDQDDSPMTLTAWTDPVLAELWDNPLDAIYDQLQPR